LLGSVRHTDLRSLDLADLLGRGEIALDADAISNTISGKTVLVTGAGGSIGSELCRQVARFDPRRLVMLDRDESGLHATQLTLSGHGLLDGDDTVLADIRDAARMHEVMNDIRPDVVFHAAA
jgi:FlaA1/EpsC-like NDP-sugar epimerase